MRKFLKISLIAASSILSVLLCLIAVLEYRSNRKLTEVYRQDFPDGTRTLVISHVGEPIFPYGEDRMRVSVLKSRTRAAVGEGRTGDAVGDGRTGAAAIKGGKTVYDTLVMVRNDGARGRFSVEWEKGEPTVTLSGDEMDDIRLEIR